MSSMTGCSFSAPGLLAMRGVHQSVRVPSPAPVYMCVCSLPHYGMYVCVCVSASLFACLTRVPSPYVTSSLTGPHDRDRGAGRWPRVGLTPPDPQTPAGPCVCACVCMLGHRCPNHVAPCSLFQLGPLITGWISPLYLPLCIPPSRPFPFPPLFVFF